MPSGDGPVGRARTGSVGLPAGLAGARRSLLPCLSDAAGTAARVAASGRSRAAPVDGCGCALLASKGQAGRRANSRDGITGELICRADIYLPWLEVPEAQVRAAMERIARDDRYLAVKVHVAEPVCERVFGDRAIHHDPAASWVRLQREVAGGAVERARTEEIAGFFLRLPVRSRTPGAG